MRWPACAITAALIAVTALGIWLIRERLRPKRPQTIREARARFREGVSLLRRGRAVQAEASLLQSLAADPTAKDCELKLRELYMLQLRREDFRTLMRSRRGAQRWGLTDLLDFVVAGHVPQLMAGNWMERVSLFVQNDPQDLHSRIAMARYYSALSQYREAAEIASEALQLDPANAHAAAILVDALVNMGRVSEAQTVLDRALASTDHPALLRAQGTIAFVSQQYSQASEKFEEALKLEPDNPSLMYQLGLCRERAGASAEAAERLRCAKELANLIDTAQKVMQRTQTDSDPHEVASELMQLGKLLLDCDLGEDAHYCFEFVLLLEPARADAQELYDKTRPMAMPRANLPHPLVSSDRQVAPGAGKPVAAVPAAKANDAVIALQLEHVSLKRGVSFQYFTGETGNKYLIETLGGGVCAFDCDADGWPDLYFAQGSRLPPGSGDQTYRDRLFRNSSGAEFQDVSEPAGLDDPNYTVGCCAGDIDSDGFSDLVIANFGAIRAYHNRGDGSFAEVSQQLGIQVAGMHTSLALADLDRDGDLDLYIVNYLASQDVCRDRVGKVFACHPSAFPAEQDRLFENEGDGRFLDVTDYSGIKVADGKGLGIVVADLDNDSWPDVFIANDSTPNFLFQNISKRRQAGRATVLDFEECGLAAGAALSRDGRARAGMGIACADFDRNGFLDLYVTNYYLETNALFLNQGRLNFVDSVRPACLVADTTPLLGFGTQAIDADLDGNLDLFVANGHIDDYTDVDRHVMWKMPPKLYRHSGNLEFQDVSRSAGPYFENSYLGRGVARLDWNRDGRPDLIVVHQNEPVALLENVTATSAHSIIVDLVGTGSNRDAINARCSITAGTLRQTLEICGGDGYLVSNERRQIIGLGSQSVVDELEVTWPSGRHDRFQSLPADVGWLIVEGRPPLIGDPVRRN